MEKSEANPKIDFFFSNAQKWQKEFEILREIPLDCGLTEELKWGKPCYSFSENNIVLIHGFKEYCALLLFKGVLIKDTHGILIQQTKNVQVARQIRFTSTKEIMKLKPILKSYVQEAIKIEKSGLKTELKKTPEYIVPIEFQNKMASMPALKAAFKALTPGRQRGYLLHFSSPKQSSTRQARIEKCTPQILKGKGLND